MKTLKKEIDNLLEMNTRENRKIIKGENNPFDIDLLLQTAGEHDVLHTLTKTQLIHIILESKLTIESIYEELENMFERAGIDFDDE